MKFALAILAVGALVLMAHASSITPQIGGGISNGFDGGISAKTSPGGGGGCNGTIDLSTGCTMPMMR